MDITEGINYFMGTFITIARNTYNTLDNIKLYGFSMLELLITLNIIMVFITIVLPRVNKNKIGMESERRK